MSEKPEQATSWREWLPLVSAIVVAISSLLVAGIAASSTKENTEKDYVSLAMSVLQSPNSSQPSKRWAVEVLSKLSPVEIPDPLKQGLITGKDNFPLVPLPCLNQLRESDLLKPVAVEPLPKGDTQKEWMIFTVGTAGQLEIANNRLEGARKVLDICTRATPIPKE